MIDIRWIKNRKTKKSSLKLVNRVPYNDYPEGTVTVDLIGVTQKTPEAKIHFVFPEKKGECPEWDWKGNTVNYKNVNWSFYCLASMIFNEAEKDYDYYFNFYNGKEWALMNEREFEIVYSTMKNIKRDLVDLLAGHKDGFRTSK